MPTLTINTSASHSQRIAQAYGAKLGLTDDDDNPRAATAAEVKKDIIATLKHTVYKYERTTAVHDAESKMTKIEPS